MLRIPSVHFLSFSIPLFWLLISKPALADGYWSIWTHTSFEGSDDKLEQCTSGGDLKCRSSVVPGIYSFNDDRVRIEQWSGDDPCGGGSGGGYASKGGAWDQDNESCGRKDEPDQCEAMAGNPINFLTGNKTQTESDFASSINPLFKFERTYNSLYIYSLSVNGGSPSFQNFRNWRNNLSESIRVVASATPNRLEVFRPSGVSIDFEKNVSTGSWESYSDVEERVEEYQDGSGDTFFRLIDSSDSIEIYDSVGELQSISDRHGNEITVTNQVISSTETKTTITDGQTGNTIQLIRSKSWPDQILEMIDPSGASYLYEYDSNYRLSAVVYPDDDSDPNNNPKRIYHYNESAHIDGSNSFLTALTGITDEEGNRYATWKYNSDGAAYYSEHGASGSGIDQVTIDYTYINDFIDPRVTVSNALGHETTYHYTLINGAKRITSVDGHATPSGMCVATSKDTSFDSNGFKNEITDREGNVTSYTRDYLGRELTRTEAAGTASERMITTEWHSELNVPVKVTTPEDVTVYTYDSKGRLLSKQVTLVTSP